MKCPECGKAMEITLADGDGLGDSVENYECECGFQLERQTHAYISKIRIPQPISASHLDQAFSSQEGLDASDFDRLWGTKTGPSFWKKYQYDFRSNFLRFWACLDRDNRFILLAEMNKVKGK